MIELTRFDDVTIEVESSSIVRLRQSVSSLGEKGNSHIDGLAFPDYRDQPADVASRVAAEVKTFINLHQPGGKPVWFDGKKAQGPIFVPSTNSGSGVGGQAKSALKIGGKVQYVNETPDEVYAAIKAQGGKAEPPIKAQAESMAGAAPSAEPTGADVWDAELYAEQPNPGM